MPESCEAVVRANSLALHSILAATTVSLMAGLRVKREHAYYQACYKGRLPRFAHMSTLYFVSKTFAYFCHRVREACQHRRSLAIIFVDLLGGAEPLLTCKITGSLLCLVEA